MTDQITGPDSGSVKSEVEKGNREEERRPRATDWFMLAQGVPTYVPDDGHHDQVVLARIGDFRRETRDILKPTKGSDEQI